MCLPTYRTKEEKKKRKKCDGQLYKYPSSFDKSWNRLKRQRVRGEKVSCIPCSSANVSQSLFIGVVIVVVVVLVAVIAWLRWASDVFRKSLLLIVTSERIESVAFAEQIRPLVTGRCAVRCHGMVVARRKRFAVVFARQAAVGLFVFGNGGLDLPFELGGSRVRQPTVCQKQAESSMSMSTEGKNETFRGREARRTKTQVDSTIEGESKNVIGCPIDIRTRSFGREESSLDRPC